MQGDSVTNQQIYEHHCRESVIRAIEGIDTTIFVYGQTGAGKTHTILGKNDTSYNGIIYQGLQDIFGSIPKESSSKFIIKLSYLEIYNDMVYDLLTD